MTPKRIFRDSNTFFCFLVFIIFSCLQKLLLPYTDGGLFWKSSGRTFEASIFSLWWQEQEEAKDISPLTPCLLCTNFKVAKIKMCIWSGRKKKCLGAMSEQEVDFKAVFWCISCHFYRWYLNKLVGG